jgi:hypothetical protein
MGRSKLPGEQEADQGGDEYAGRQADQEDFFQGLEPFQAFIVMACYDHDECPLPTFGGWRLPRGCRS